MRQRCTGLFPVLLLLLLLLTAGCGGGGGSNNNGGGGGGGGVSRDFDFTTSPSGQFVAFCRQVDEDIPGNVDLYTRNANGTGEQMIFDGSYTLAKPVWSPESDEIAFQDAYSGSGAFLTVINVSTRAIRRIYTGAAIPEEWVGDQITFRTSTKRYRVREDGSGLVLIENL